MWRVYSVRSERLCVAVFNVAGVTQEWQCPKCYVLYLKESVCQVKQFTLEEVM